MAYKQTKPPLVGEHAFPLTGFVCKSANATFKCNVSRLANKPRQWKSMLSHQGWFSLLIIMPPLLVSQTTEFEICISIYIRDSAPSQEQFQNFILLNTLALRSSGPDASCIFRLFNSLRNPFGTTGISPMG